jgi:uncharacterized membrane protein YkoI
MTTVSKLIAVLAVIALVGGVGVLAADALDDDELPEVVTLQDGSAPESPAATPEPALDRDDRPLSPSQETRATAAALKVTNGGTVAELDRSDDPGEAYEVEVIKDGREYDVALDTEFRPVPNRRYDD